MIYRWADLKRKFRSFISLRVNIFICMMILGFIPSIVLRYGIISAYETRAVSVRTAEVQTQLKILADHLLTYNYLQDNSSAVVNTELELISNLYDGRVLIIGPNLKVIKDTYGIAEGRTIISEEVVKCFGGDSEQNYDKELGYIEMTVPISEVVEGPEGESGIVMEGGTPEQAGGTVRGAMLISVSCDTINQTLLLLSRRALIMQVIMMLVIVCLAYVVSGIMVKPLQKVTKSISEVKEGFSEEAIDVPDYVETVHIIDAFNQLLRRMKVLNDSREEFVSNVSHELKTPMTSMKVLADSLIMQGDAVPAELYREFMEDIATEIDRENKIITDLLSLVKMDKTQQVMNITEVSVNELTEVVLKRLRPIARKRDIEVTFESFCDVRATIDEVKLSLVLTNLVENAIKYNKEHGWVKVSLDADHQFFTVIVSDSGIGIPEDSLEHIYERFYRVDKSHSREIGGTGLGLAITRNAVLMHRGSIQVESVPEEGSVFTVKIPLTYLVQ